MRPLTPFFGLLGLAGCTHVERRPDPIALDSLLAFSDPKLCEPTAAHFRFLRSMIGGDANVGFRAGKLVAPARLRAAFDRIKVKRHDGWWTIGVPVRGSLFGLPLAEIVHSLPEGGDAGDETYVFDVPVQRVESVLRARGFPAKSGEDVQLGPPDGMAHLMSLRSDPDDARRTVFTCGYE